jgi:hypothetical protein
MRKKKKSTKLEEPLGAYTQGKMKIYKSFEEQAADELAEMAKLSPLEILTQMRQMINVAYGMHGYDPDNLPKKHSIRIISYK